MLFACVDLGADGGQQRSNITLHTHLSLINGQTSQIYEVFTPFGWWPQQWSLDGFGWFNSVLWERISWNKQKQWRSTLRWRSGSHRSCILPEDFCVQNSERWPSKKVQNPKVQNPVNTTEFRIRHQQTIMAKTTFFHLQYFPFRFNLQKKKGRCKYFESKTSQGAT